MKYVAKILIHAQTSAKTLTIFVFWWQAIKNDFKHITSSVEHVHVVVWAENKLIKNINSFNLNILNY